MRRETEVYAHLQRMRHLISESRDRINELEACLDAIVVETKISIPHGRGTVGGR